MYLIEELLPHLKDGLSDMPMVGSVEIYRGRLLVVNIRTENLFFGIDISGSLDVFLVCRSNETRDFLSNQMSSRLGMRTKIATKYGSIVDFIELVNFDNLVESFRSIILQLVSGERDPSTLLQRAVRQLKSIAQDQKLLTQRETYRDMADFYKGRLLSIPETLHKIKKNRLSIARYGDGEIKCMVTAFGCRFQKHDWQLMYELRDIASQKTDLLVCFPNPMHEDKFWKEYWSEFWPMCKFYINQDVIGDSMITRPEAFYAYKELASNLWANLWENKNICFVTGADSRLNGKHSIFANAKSSAYVHSKSSDAYDQIDETLGRCLENNDADIYLIALGPTGTALASRLQKEGKWALDIGHLNNSYDTVFHNAARPEKIPYPRNA